MADDAQRVWFREVVAHLRSQWREGMEFEAIIELRNHLDTILQEARSDASIKSAFIKCKRCGFSGWRPAPHVSVRAMILSLHKFGIAEPEPTYTLETNWAIYRRVHGLDMFGAPVVNGIDLRVTCDHLPGKSIL